MSPSTSQLRVLKAPVPDTAALTKREQIILLQGSKLHGCIFPPWKGDPSPDEFRDAFEDAAELHLSTTQQRLLDGWKRPSGAQLRGCGACHPRLDLVQDITNDCSVVASLCALSAHAERLAVAGGQALFPALFPSGEPSTNGKYLLRLHFNGCDRKVVIDDRLPRSQTSRSLHVFDRTDAEVLWPALVEKAYLKIRGGYNFLGSTSGTDIWVLAGWIPEQVFLHDEELDLQAVWRRVAKAYGYGDVLITIGTGKLSPREQDAFGLAGEHAYAVLGVSEVDGRRRMLVKNPWVDGKAWTKLSGDRGSDDEVEDRGSSKLGTPGTFWMDWNDVLQYFEAMHLSWNPGLFAHRKDRHFSWDLGSRSGPGSFSKNPQYLLRSEKGGTVWLLLTKHFQSRPSADTEPSPVDDAGWPVDFISLYLFESSHRVALTHGSKVRSPYIDSHHVLLRFEMTPRTNYVAVVSEQDMRPVETHFTLSAFSLTALPNFRPAEDEHAHSVEAHGAWTPATAGGSVNSLDYPHNPHFALALPRASPLLVTLETARDDLAVHVKLLWLKGQRVAAPLTARDVVGDSGEYRPGAAALRLPDVAAGVYTLVTSTFTDGQLGAFTLRVRSDVDRCALRPIPPEDAGRLITRLAPAVFGPGTDRVLAPLAVARATTLRARTWSGGSGSGGSAGGSPGGTELRIAVEYGQGPDTRLLAHTGAFRGAQRVVSTPDVDLTAALCDPRGPGVWLVLERAGGGARPPAPARVSVELLATERGVGAGPWGMESDEPVERVRARLEAARVRPG